MNDKGGGGGSWTSQQHGRHWQLHEGSQHSTGLRMCEYFKLPRGLGRQNGGRLHSQAMEQAFETAASEAAFDGKVEATIVSQIGEFERE